MCSAKEHNLFSEPKLSNIVYLLLSTTTLLIISYLITILFLYYYLSIIISILYIYYYLSLIFSCCALSLTFSVRAMELLHVSHFIL